MRAALLIERAVVRRSDRQVEVVVPVAVAAGCQEVVEVCLPIGNGDGLHIRRQNTCACQQYIGPAEAFPLLRRWAALLKSYRDLLSGWHAPVCTCAASDIVRLNDAYPHWAGPDERQGIFILRFRGRCCWRVFSVLPDFLLPRCTYPASVRDRAVAACVRGEAGLGVAKSTVGVGL